MSDDHLGEALAAAAVIAFCAIFVVIINVLGQRNDDLRDQLAMAVERAHIAEARTEQWEQIAARMFGLSDATVRECIANADPEAWRVEP